VSLLKIKIASKNLHEKPTNTYYSFSLLIMFDSSYMSDHYLVVTKVRERLAVRKQEAQTFEGERFNLRRLNDLEIRKQYQIEITNRFAALENVSDEEDINRAWESIK
jgi:hypothetical protein